MHEIEQFTLDNGLRVVLQPDSRLPLVASHLLYEGGSSDDPPGRSGLAHLCEHLALVGPSNGSQGRYLRAIEEAGGTANGATHHDRTSFKLFLLAKSLPLGLWVEASRMLRPAATSSRTLARERTVLFREHQQARDDAQARHFEKLHHLLYNKPDERYRRPPAGRPEEIRAVTCDEVEAYLNEFYRPERAILALVGDFSVGEAADEVEEMFGGIPAADRTPPEPRGAPTRGHGPAADERRARLRARVPDAQVYLAFRAPGFGQPGWHTAALWARGVALGSSSPLRRRLQGEAGLARQVKAGMVHMRDASTVVIEAVALRGVAPERLERALTGAVSELVEEGLPADVVRRAAKKAVTEHHAAIEPFDRRAEDLARLASHLGDASEIETVEERFRRIDSEAIRAFGREFCRDGGRAVLTVAPEECAA